MVSQISPATGERNQVSSGQIVLWGPAEYAGAVSEYVGDFSWKGKMNPEDISDLRKDKERLDWFSAPHGCEPAEGVRYDGTRQWRYMGLWFENLRDAIDYAMTKEDMR